MAVTKPRASTEQVHALLRAAVLAGVHEPGARLKTAALCEEYGASVSVVREALTRLAEQGLVESEPRIGFRVRQVSLADLRDLTATRIEIEGLALRAAIRDGDVAWESDVIAAHHRLERTPLLADDGPRRISDAWEQAHGAFHAILLEGSGRPWLIGLACTLRDAAELYRRWSQTQEPGRDIAAEHRGLMDAAVARDADLAVSRLSAHYQHTADILERSFAVSGS